MSPPKRTIRTLGGSSGSSRANSISETSLPSFKKAGNSSSGAQRPSSQQNSTISRDMTVGISDEELVNMDIKDLNDYLRRLPKDAAAQARKRRRLLKNRGYAQSTRTKRLTTIEEASSRKDELRSEIGTLKREIERLRSKRDQLRMTRARLERAQGISTYTGGPAVLKQDVHVKTEDFDGMQ